MRIHLLPSVLLLCLAHASSHAAPPATVRKDSPLDDRARPVATTAALLPAETAAALKVPPGFHVELIAGEPQLVQPIAYTIDDRGRLWVVENTNYPTSPGTPKDRILVLEDTKGDGSFDKTTVFWDKATFTSGIAVGFGGVWLGSPPNLLFLPVTDWETPKPAGDPQVVLDGWDAGDTHETLNDFMWGPDGWLYGTQGVFNRSQIGKPGAPASERTYMDAGVWRYHPQQKRFERWCEGVSNQWGLDWNDRGEAVFAACVVPHLWHAVEGGRYQRQAGPHPDAHTYDEIQTIAWGRYEKAAYCGAMVYLGGAFPEDWRDAFFFHDIHMNKQRCETLVRNGSGFRSERRTDFIVSADPWFRGLSPQYGPDGGVFINDWYDRVPCHQQREFTDRSNGRIYKVVPDGLKTTRVDLAKATDAELVAMQLHRNDWFVRHSRRILQERGPNPATTAALERMLFENPDETRQLRALWALQSQGALGESATLRALAAKSEHVRGWAVTCASENGQPSEAVTRQITALAAQDSSAIVRRRIASAAQRIPTVQRWAWLEPLASRADDLSDPNIPFLLWYALEPAAAADPTRALALVRKAADTRIAEWTARRLASDAVAAGPQGARFLEPLCTFADHTSDARAAVLRGILAAARGQTQLPAPSSWEAAYAVLKQDANPTVRSQAQQLAVLFGSTTALAELRTLLGDKAAPPDRRTEALQTLARQKDQPALDLALALLDTPGPLRAPVLRALVEYADPRVEARLVPLMATLPAPEKQDALQTLTARPASVGKLLAAIDAGSLPRSILGAPTARKIQGFKNPDFDAWLEKNWGMLRSSSAQKSSEITGYKKFLSADAVARADVKRGRELFRGICAPCHQLFGAGGDIGPHLPGSFTDLDYLLQNILDPNAVIGKDYQTTYLNLTDGSLMAGIITAEDASGVTMKSPGAPAPVTVAKDRIKSRELSPNSLMPEGLLNGLEEPDVRNLFLYLRQSAEIP